MAKKDKDEKKRKGSFVNEVSALTFEDAFVKLDDMAASSFDMFACDWGPHEDRDGYIRIIVYGWENDDTRSLYSV